MDRRVANPSAPLFPHIPAAAVRRFHLAVAKKENHGLLAMAIRRVCVLAVVHFLMLPAVWLRVQS